MKTTFTFLFVLFSFVFVVGQDDHVQVEQLSPQARATLITIAPGNQLYSVFGHTAIRISDPGNRFDRVYNYGTFDSSIENFGYRFVKGDVDYIIAVDSYERFLRFYNHYKRAVVEQHLNVDAEKINEIYRFLENNLLPENKGYFYQFFYDNCSTRVRDLFEELFPDHIYQQAIVSDLSFRDMIHQYLREGSWLRFGIDLIIAGAGDEKADFRGQMFLPDFLYTHMEVFTYGDTQPLISGKEATLRFLERPIKNGFLTPVNVFLGLLILELIFFFLRKRSIRFLEWYDRIWFLVMSVGASLFIFMWTATFHTPTYGNWNLLWINPLFLGILVLSFTNKRTLKRNLEMVVLTFLVLTLVGWFFWPQDLPDTAIIIIALLILKEVRRLLPAVAEMSAEGQTASMVS